MKDMAPLSDVLAIAQEMRQRFGDRAEAEVMARAERSREDKEAVILWTRVAEAIKAFEKPAK